MVRKLLFFERFTPSHNFTSLRLNDACPFKTKPFIERSKRPCTLQPHFLDALGGLGGGPDVVVSQYQRLALDGPLGTGHRRGGPWWAALGSEGGRCRRLRRLRRTWWFWWRAFRLWWGSTPTCECGRGRTNGHHRKRLCSRDPHGFEHSRGSPQSRWRTQSHPLDRRQVCEGWRALGRDRSQAF